MSRDVNPEKMYNLKFGETCLISDTPWHTFAVRVPGGWVVKDSNSSVFVPYSDEYKKREDEMFEPPIR